MYFSIPLMYADNGDMLSMNLLMLLIFILKIIVIWMFQKINPLTPEGLMHCSLSPCDSS